MIVIKESVNVEAFISDKNIYVDENILIGGGKSGNVYLLNDEEVIKLYSYVIPYCNSHHQNKLDILRKSSVTNWIIPLEIVYNEEGNIIGYTMKYINGKDGDAILKLSSKF